MCVADLHSASARDVVAEIASHRGQAFDCTADVAQEADNSRLVNEVMARHGGLDVAFLNAGYGGWETDLLTAPLQGLDRILAVNLRGCLLGIRAVVPLLRPGGTIVVTASAGGLVGVRANPVYAASKHGVVGLVRSLAPTLAGRGLRINAVCPGGVRTPMVGIPVQDLEAGPDTLPTVAYGERAHPEHIAEVALFLASPRAAGINGAAWLADAGQTSVLTTPTRSV